VRHVLKSSMPMG